MKKIFFTLAIIGIVIIGLFWISRVLGFIRFHTIPTSSNEPAIKTGSLVKSTNLKDYEKGDFIIYRADSVYYINRLIAVESDILEIKRGIVYVNNINFDKKLNLIHTYKLTLADYNALNEKKIIPDNIMSIKLEDESIGLFLEDRIAAENNLTAKKLISPIDEPDSYIVKKYDQKWNKDNFGPLKIPRGKVFVMGDNRDNSEDSRYTGCINISDIQGTIIR